MNCREVQALLDDLVDGDLPEKQRREVERHLRGCAECRSSEARLRVLLSRVGAMPRTLAPARDPWPGILSRIMAGEVIEHDFAGRGRRWYLLGAGLLLLVIEAAVASRLPRVA